MPTKSAWKALEWGQHHLRAGGVNILLEETSDPQGRYKIRITIGGSREGATFYSKVTGLNEAKTDAVKMARKLLQDALDALG